MVDKRTEEALRQFVYVQHRGFYEVSHDVARSLFAKMTSTDKTKFFNVPAELNEDKFYKEFLSAMIANIHVKYMTSCKELNLDKQLNIDHIGAGSVRAALNDWGSSAGFSDEWVQEVWMGTRKYFGYADCARTVPPSSTIAAGLTEQLIPQLTKEQRLLAGVDLSMFFMSYADAIPNSLKRLSDLNYDIETYLKENYRASQENQGC